MAVRTAPQSTVCTPQVHCAPGGIVVTVASGIVGALALCARDALPLELLAGSAPRAGEGRVSS